KDKIPRINSINNPWNNSSQNLLNESTNIPEISDKNRSITYSQYNIIEERKAELALDKKTFESLV
ncbi:781_t:CDS:1, partial [Dentiscutata heterogama]